MRCGLPNLGLRDEKQVMLTERRRTSGHADRLQASRKRAIAPCIALPRGNAVFGDTRRTWQSAKSVHAVRINSEVVMKHIFWSVLTVPCLVIGTPALAQAPVPVNPTDPQPT